MNRGAGFFYRHSIEFAYSVRDEAACGFSLRMNMRHSTSEASVDTGAAQPISNRLAPSIRLSRQAMGIRTANVVTTLCSRLNHDLP